MNDISILLDAIEGLRYSMNQSQIALKIRIYELTEATKRLEAVHGKNKKGNKKGAKGKRAPPSKQRKTKQVQEQV